jgi:hypothetical protein
MLILARVCADFYNKNRTLLGRIVPKDLGRFIELPDDIKQDPLFKMLVDDGSIKFPADDAKDKSLEQDPFAGTTADGKDIKPKTKPTAKPKAEPNPETKSETKAVDKPAEKPETVGTK